MEKRKLAQIPREEATDEMVRFAERAAGTHIVTTRDIEKDLLMMTFYPIDKLKKGEKSAQLRTFFSKNDYISQDLTAERVKWLTAAFDRMECIHLYEYHWDRDKGNRYTPNMFFWTDADIDRMRGFFKECDRMKNKPRRQILLTQSWEQSRKFRKTSRNGYRKKRCHSADIWVTQQDQRMRLWCIALIVMGRHW